MIGSIRRPTLTSVIAASLIAVFGYESYQVGWRTLGLGGGLIVPPLAIDWSVHAPAVQRGEWWRLLTAGFVHFDVLHLGLNVIGLLWSGQLVERRFGRPRYVLLYVSSLVAGSALAYLTTIESRAVSGGASGAIMGLFGAISVFGMRYWSQREEAAWAVTLVAATLVSGFLNPGVSNAAHLGGFFVGLVVAAAAGLRPGLDESIRVAEKEAEQQSALRTSRTASIPEEVVIDPANQLIIERPLRQKSFFVACAAFFVAGAVIAFPESFWGGAFFLLLALACANGVRQRLELNPRGFRVTNTPASRLVQWRDVERFYAIGDEVLFTYMPDHVARADRSASFLGKLLVGRRRGSGLRFFGMRGSHLSALMDEWRARWTTEA